MSQSWDVHDPLFLIDQPPHQRALKASRLSIWTAGMQMSISCILVRESFSQKLISIKLHTVMKVDGGHRGNKHRFGINIPHHEAPMLVIFSFIVACTIDSLSSF